MVREGSGRAYKGVWRGSGGFLEGGCLVGVDARRPRAGLRGTHTDERASPLRAADLRGGGTFGGSAPYLDGEDGDLIRVVDGVPHAEVAPVLRHHHVALRHPLHVRAVVQHGGALLLRQVVKVQLPLLVAEQQVRRARVELQPVNLGGGTVGAA
eukprot:9503851-Pyramimonas_sp.AAC.15